PSRRRRHLLRRPCSRVRRLPLPLSPDVVPQPGAPSCHLELRCAVSIFVVPASPSSESSNSFAKMMMLPGLVSNLQEALQNRKVRDKSVSGYSVTYKETMEACSAKVSGASAFEISGIKAFLRNGF
ncbi:hypothetical protein PIB30_094386, partial [Stylosanthes scabra]|nr:hypothetical protein [Stylosanthes scabra]